MNFISIELFNTPKIKVDNRLIVFPFKKAEALFYYVAVKKQATRDELVNIIWGEADEETARKNLRQAIYTIKKAFDIDILITPNRSLVMINPDIEIHIDALSFLENKGEEALELYKGEFLQGFSVKDSELYEEWLLSQRESYRDYYIKRLTETAGIAFKSGDYAKAETYGRILLAADTYNEAACRMLMKAYALEGHHGKAIETYHRMEESLDKELGITPSEDTKKFYNEIMLAKNSSANGSQEEGFFYGREAELSEMISCCGSMREGEGKIIAIKGEAGIGKTRLKERFLAIIQRDELLLEANCYQAEESYMLRPWSDILSKLSTALDLDALRIPEAWKSIISGYFPRFSVKGTVKAADALEKPDPVRYKLLEDAVLGLFERVTAKQKLIVVFDDIQWMDSLSISLLLSVALHNRSNRLLLLLTCRNEHYAKLNNLFLTLSRYKSTKLVELQRFNKLQADAFAQKALPYFNWTAEQKQRIFEETDGNAFFMTELINTIKERGYICDISDRAQDILRSRFMGILNEGMKLLNIASVFFDKVSMDMLKQLSGKDELELLDILEMLQDKIILKEICQGQELFYQFTHLKLREFVYNQQSLAKRRAIHQRVGQLLEERLRNDWRDMHLYPKLIYHFESSGDIVSTLKYKIKHMDYSLDFSHELFPVLSNDIRASHSILDSNSADVIKQMEVLEGQIARLEEDTLSKGLEKVELVYLHLKGRYMIRIGEYDQGLECITKMVEKSIAIKDYGYCIKGYKQLIYYGIQTHDTDAMDKYIELAVRLAGDKLMEEELGILYRLKGLGKIMVGAYEEAEQLLRHAIGILNSYDTKEGKYSLNIAACYNYLGEIRRYGMKFSYALEYYDKAIDICESLGIMKGMTVFYTNAGQAAFEMGDYHRAKAYFHKAIKLFANQEVYWGRSTAEGYLSLLLIKSGMYKEALDYLKKADYYAGKMKSPYELGVLYRIKAEIKSKMDKNLQLQKVFSECLKLSLNDYCSKGIELMQRLNSPYEIEVLKALGKGNK